MNHSKPINAELAGVRSGRPSGRASDGLTPVASWSLVIVAMLLLSSLPARAADSFTDARELYASASYEEALATLTRLRGADVDQAMLQQIDTYRAFCLFALGRTNDAQAVVDEVVTANPALTLDDKDASPKIAAMFADARKRLLPDIIHAHYRAAKIALDKKDYAAAEPELTLVRGALEQAEKLGVLDETSAALRDIVDAFVQVVQVARPAAAPPTAPKSVAAPATVGFGSAATIPPPPPALFDSSDRSVIAPIALKQAVPAMPVSVVSLLQARKITTPGVLAVIVDEHGLVESARMQVELNSVYDKMVLNAAKGWLYKPATKDGVPVKYEKLIALSPPK